MKHDVWWLACLWLALPLAAEAQTQTDPRVAGITVRPAEEIPDWAYDAASGQYLHPPTFAEITRQAAKGNAIAEFRLANAYQFGQYDQAPNYGKAQDLYWASAKQGYLPAIRMLAQNYQKGTGGATDIEMAIELYAIAGESGDGESQNQLGSIYQIRANNPADAALDDYSKAVYWYQKAAAQNAPFAAFNLAQLYKTHEPAKAVAVLQAATEMDDGSFGYPMLVDNLADLYYSYEAEGVPRNLPEAFRLTTIAANLDNARAQHRLGAMYYQGEGTTQDDILAYTWLRLSAENNDPDGKDDYATIKDQITPSQMTIVDDKVAALRQQIADAFKTRQAAYVKAMAAKGVIIIPADHPFPGRPN